MHIDWAALGVVAVVSIATSVIFTILLATGIRLVSAAKIKSNEGGSGTATVSLGYVLLGIAGLLVLFGIYVIVPQFHWSPFTHHREVGHITAIHAASAGRCRLRR